MFAEGKSDVGADLRTKDDMNKPIYGTCNEEGLKKREPETF